MLLAHELIQIICLSFLTAFKPFCCSHVFLQWKGKEVWKGRITV